MNENGGSSPGDVVRAYLRVFETGQVGDFDTLVADDVECWGANQHLRGRQWPAGSVDNPGLSNCRLEVLELFEAGSRVTVYFRSTYRHDASGRDIAQTGLKMYEVEGGKITRMWGEVDVWGMLQQLGKVPAGISFD